MVFLELSLIVGNIPAPAVVMPHTTSLGQLEAVPRDAFLPHPFWK